MSRKKLSPGDVWRMSETGERWVVEGVGRGAVKLIRKGPRGMRVMNVSLKVLKRDFEPAPIPVPKEPDETSISITPLSMRWQPEWGILLTA